MQKIQKNKRLRYKRGKYHVGFRRILWNVDARHDYTGC